MSDPGRRRIALWTTAAAALVLAAVVFAAVPATTASAAQTEPAPTSTESPAPAQPDGSDEGIPVPQPSRRPVTAPAPPSAPSPAPTGPALTVDQPPSPLRLPTSISGTRDSGTEVQVQLDDGSGQPLCIAPASSSTSWSCSVRSLPSGAALPLRIVALGATGTTEQRVTVAWLDAPTISASTQATTAGQVSGTGFPGAAVTATVPSTGSACTAAVDSTGGWTCVLSEPLPSGSYTASATQSTAFSAGPSASSTTVTVLIDKDAPAAPRITSPAAGTKLPLAGSVFAGTGEDGNSVILFAGVRPLCQAVVDKGAWICTAAEIPAGDFEVTALQMDSAGNASAASPAIALNFAPTAPTAAAPPAGSAPAAPASPAAPGAAPPTDGGVAAPAAPVAPQTGPAQTPRWIEALRAPTSLGTSLAPLASIAGPQLATAAGLAAATVGLIIVPALLAARAIRLRVMRLPSMTGRNRSRGDGRTSTSPLVDRWTRAVLGTSAAAALLTLSMPVLAQSNYVRLAVAAAIAVAVLNVAGTIGVVRVARGLFGVDVVTVTRLPLLALTALTSLLSRVFVLAPPLVAGQILGTRFGIDASPRQRGNVSLAQVIVTCGLAVGGWGIYSAWPATPGTLGLMITEGSGLLTLTAATSAAFASLPLGFLPGAALLERSRVLWAATTTLTWSLLFLVLTAVAPGHTAPALTSMMAVALGFGAISAAVWLWTRFVEPFLRTS